MDVGLKLLNLMGAKGIQTYTKNICPEHETCSSTCSSFRISSQWWAIGVLQALIYTHCLQTHSLDVPDELRKIFHSRLA